MKPELVFPVDNKLNFRLLSVNDLNSPMFTIYLLRLNLPVLVALPDRCSSYFNELLKAKRGHMGLN